MVKVQGDLLDSHGFAILESGQMDIVSEALETVEESSLGATGLALRGHIEAKSGRLDTAEAWFLLGLDKARDEISRATIAVYYAGELAWRRRTDACDMLEAVLNSTSLPRPLLIDLRSSYAQALAIASRLEEARSSGIPPFDFERPFCGAKPLRGGPCVSESDMLSRGPR